MRRILPGDQFSAWFHGFLPRLDQQKTQALLTPVTVSDRSDGRIVHLDGLNLSRSRNLPPEMRKELLQGADDGYPPGYEALLKNYYKELSKAEK